MGFKMSPHALILKNRFQLSTLLSVSVPSAVTKSSYSTVRGTDRFGRIVTRRVLKNKTTKARGADKKWKVLELPATSFAAPAKTAPIPNLVELTKTSKTSQEKAKVASHYIWEWIKDNYATLVLNFGSICTLTAFTRSDILELRCLSMTGSLSSVIYSITKKIYFPAIWSTVFALTNAYKVFFILEERRGKAKTLTSTEKKVYLNNFKAHGVTPRQFEKLIHIANEVHLKRGQCLVEKGETFHSVYLVKSGAMDARTSMQRRVTAASTDASTQTQIGGDSGLWIGELAFLDAMAVKDIAQKVEDTDLRLENGRINDFKPSKDMNKPHVLKSTQYAQSPIRSAILSYVATEDTTVYEFDHEQLIDLLSTSADLRSSMTRCMTAAVVSKVVNLYTSKVDADKPIWQTFLEQHWKSGISDVDAVKTKVVDGQGLEP
jgi:CRP-like cAMP-binding protein